MKKRSLIVLSFMALGAAGCAGGAPEAPPGSHWEEITQAQCESDFPVPFTDENGQPCNLPFDADTCAGIDWDKDDPPDEDYACFGFSEDLDQCENCNRLDLPKTGEHKWTLCRNQQYMDCLMNNRLPDYGEFCFVTAPDDIDYDAGAVDAGATVRVTTREVCYYYHKKGAWPPACPAAACEPDAGTPDASTPDAGTADAGMPDAGTADAGTPDAGTPDAGTADAGVSDAG